MDGGKGRGVNGAVNGVETERLTRVHGKVCMGGCECNLVAHSAQVRVNPWEAERGAIRAVSLEGVHGTV